MSDGFEALDEMVETMRKLGAAPAEVAKLAAPLVDVEAKRTAAAGTSPTGTAWAAKKKGGRALANAATAVEARVVGDTVVQIRIVGNDTGSQKAQSIQHYGTKRIPARPLIPQGGSDLPPGISRAFQKAASAFFQRATGAT